jgi:membrane protein DedA with SNARE-associated domain
METALQLVNQYGDIALFLLLVVGIIGLPVPDETLLTFAGYLIFKGHLHFPTTLVAAFAGSVCGITGSYLIGRTGGLYVIHKYGRFLHVTPERLDYVHAWFERVGRWGLFFGYFIPGVRHFTAIIAGTSALEYPVFALFAYSGGLLWVSTFLTLGYFLGEEWQRIGKQIQDRAEEIAIVVVVLGLIGFGIRYWLKRRAGK